MPQSQDDQVEEDLNNPFPLDGSEVDIGAAAATLGAAARRRYPARPRVAHVLGGSSEEIGGMMEIGRRDRHTPALVGYLCGAAAEAVESGQPDPHPMLSRLLRAAGGDRAKPRLVRVDSPETYAMLRKDVTELQDRVDALSQALVEHANDPHAHQVVMGAIDEIAGEVEDVASQGVPLSLPPDLQGHAWLEGDQVCASVQFDAGGQTVICTSAEPLADALHETLDHADAAGVELPKETAIGLAAALGAATVIKEMGAGIRSIADAVEKRAGGDPFEAFVVQLEQSVSPALASVVKLLDLQRLGDVQAKAELRQLAQSQPALYNDAVKLYLKVVHDHGMLHRTTETLKSIALAPVKAVAKIAGVAVSPLESAARHLKENRGRRGGHRLANRTVGVGSTTSGGQEWVVPGGMGFGAPFGPAGVHGLGPSFGPGLGPSGSGFGPNFAASQLYSESAARAQEAVRVAEETAAENEQLRAEIAELKAGKK